MSIATRVKPIERNAIERDAASPPARYAPDRAATGRPFRKRLSRWLGTVLSVTPWLALPLMPATVFLLWLLGMG